VADRCAHEYPEWGACPYCPAELRAQLAAALKERDEARADMAAIRRTDWAVETEKVLAENARLRAAIEPTDANVEACMDVIAAKNPVTTRGEVRCILAAIAARAKGTPRGGDL
jgi:hypothetical protein